MRALIRWLLVTLVRLYYPAISLVGRERLAANRPVVFVANHPNALLDPLVVRIAIDRPVGFLGKSTLFNNPVARVVMESFNGIPVYRQRDGGDTSQNDRTFERCRALLGRGEAIALFPEGTSHSDPQMRPMKTGAARIALSARVQHGATLGLQVIPVGLRYDSKAVFRSSARVVVGEGISVEDYVERYESDEREAVHALTEAIHAGLSEVVLQADDHALLEGVARVASWTGDSPALGDDPAEHHRRTSALLETYRALRLEDPRRAQEVVSLAADYMRGLESLGVTDPWALEFERVRPLTAVGAIARLVALAPVALIGCLLGWIPYRLAGNVARRVTSDDDELGTVKLLAGALFVLLWWVVEVVAAGSLFGAPAALAVAILAPLGGYAAVRFEERFEAVREAARHLWVRVARGDAARSLIDRRRQLATAVSEVLRAQHEER